MGLLDDAIREHLELKRLRGADPGVVAREEQEALGPIRRDSAVLDEGPEPPAQESAAAENVSTGSPDLSATGQETAEIDMDAVFDSSRDAHERASGSHDDRKAVPGAGAAHVQDAEGSAGDSLEWEMPGDKNEQPRERSDRRGRDSDTSDHPDDVLEETPDFLQDTPEQERLWFEQRPPRDFDFNE